MRSRAFTAVATVMWARPEIDGDQRAEAARAAGMAELDVRFAELLDAAHAEDLEPARALLAPLLEEEPRWADYVRVLGGRGYLPHADELV